MLRYGSSLRYSFLRTLFFLSDKLRRQPTSWEYPALSLLSNMVPVARAQLVSRRGLTRVKGALQLLSNRHL